MKDFAQIDAENRAAGRCIQCGGSGVVAAMRAINRTGDPHLNQRCRRCGGSGKLHPNDMAARASREDTPHD